MNIQIKPDVVRKLRARDELTRAQLAERSKITERQIARIEDCKDQFTKVRENTVQKLAFAFEVKVEMLTGDVPFINMKSPKVELDPQLQLQYDLVSARYKISNDALIAFAPLLFTMMAEATIKHHEKKANRCEELMDEIFKLSGLESVEFNSEEAFQTELHWSRNLLNSINISAGNPMLTSDPEDFPFARHPSSLFKQYYSDEALNYTEVLEPLSVFLKAFLAEYEISDDKVFLPENSIKDFQWNELASLSLLEGDLDKITNGNAGAREALKSGRFRLHHIPYEVYGNEKAEERASWLADKKSEIPSDAAVMVQQYMLNKETTPELLEVFGLSEDGEPLDEGEILL